MAKKKKLGALAVAMSEKQFVGPEPMWTGVATNGNMADYYNWCSKKLVLDFAKRSFLEYLAVEKIPSTYVATLPEYRFTTIGFTARLILANDDRLIPADVMQRFQDKLKKLVELAPMLREETVVTVPQVRPVAPKIDRRVEDGLAFYEKLHDEIMFSGGLEPGHRITLRNGVITPRVVTLVLPQLDKEIKELDLVTSGKDPELAEGYANTERPHLIRTATALALLKHELMEIAKILPKKEATIRKIRAKKIKPANLQVKALKFKEKDDKYNVTSVDPRTIVGAQEAWLFNVTYRKLTVLRAADQIGLSVKGSTIYGFDPKNSFTKMVRHPEETLKGVLAAGKVAARQTFELLKTIQYEAKGRCGEDTIILRVFK